jgi:cell division septation protein DedD
MALDKPVPPDRVPLDKSAPSAVPPRRPLAGDTTALADKPLPGDKSSKTTSSDSIGSDKTVAKSANAETSTTEKKDARVAAATTERMATARAAKPAAARSTTSASAPRAAAASSWWVQVGAFRNENSAKNLAATLREQNYTVKQSVRNGGASAPKSATLDKSAPAASTPNLAGADQYDVFVSGLSADELNTRLAGKGLSAEPSGTGVVLKPSLPLRDAVALSKDLATDGYKVQVRRAAGASAQAPRPAEPRPVPAVTSSGDALYLVRVGAFSDRATAMTTLKELQAKGYKPFIARGGS